MTAKMKTKSRKRGMTISNTSTEVTGCYRTSVVFILVLNYERKLKDFETKMYKGAPQGVKHQSVCLPILYSVCTKVLNKNFFFRDCQFCQNSEHCKLSMGIFTLIINAFYKTELSSINEHKTDKCPISIRFIAKSGYNLSCKLKRSIES